MADTMDVQAAPQNVPTQQSEIPSQLPAPNPQSTPQPQVPPPPQQQQQPQPQITPQQADIAHHAVIGKVARALLGQQIQYNVNPQTGATEATEVPEKPGQFMRSLVAGAMMGSVAGSQGHGFLQGFTRGGAASVQQQQQLDQQRRAQAQQQFKNQMEAQRNQREEAAAKTEETVKQAQIALYNVQKLHENILLNGATMQQHEQAATSGKAMLEPYMAVEGYRYHDVSEGDMNDLMQTNPSAHNYLWAVTGQRAVMGKDGQPTTELTYSAVDPHGDVKVTQGMLDQFKNVGLDKYFPETKGLKVGQTMDAQQMMALQGQYQKLYNQQLTQKADTLKSEEVQARINKDKAETAHWLTLNSKEKLEKNRSELEANALDEFDKVGGDFSKLSPKSQAVMAQTIIPKKVEDLISEAKTYLQADASDPDGKAKAALEQADQLNSLIPKGFKPPAPQLPTPKTKGEVASNDVILAYGKANGNDNAKTRAALQAAGYTIPGQPTQGGPSLGTKVGNFINKVGNLSVKDITGALGGAANPQ